MIIRYIRELFEHEQEDYYKSIIVVNFWSNNYIEYESKGDRNGYLCFLPPTLALAMASSPKLYLNASALNFYLPAPTLNFCLPVLRFTIKVYYSQSNSQCVFPLLFKIALGTRFYYSYKVYLYELSI